MTTQLSWPLCERVINLLIWYCDLDWKLIESARYHLNAGANFHQKNYRNNSRLYLFGRCNQGRTTFCKLLFSQSSAITIGTPANRLRKKAFIIVKKSVVAFLHFQKVKKFLVQWERRVQRLSRHKPSFCCRKYPQKHHRTLSEYEHVK